MSTTPFDSAVAQAPIVPAAPYNGDTMPTLATLVLQDGSSYGGYSFGAETHSVAGECVFQTGMVGYPESLTDPSYRGQILVLTYPLIGNYGVPSRAALDKWFEEEVIPAHFESRDIHVAALVVGFYTDEFSHYLAESSLGTWLAEQNIPALYGVDTRAITKKIRQQGVMLGKVLLPASVTGGPTADCPIVGDCMQPWMAELDDVPWTDPNASNLVAQVSHTEPTLYRPAGDVLRKADGTPLRILAVDVGMKYNQIRCFVRRGVEVHVVPWNYNFAVDDKDRRRDGTMPLDDDGQPQPPKMDFDGLFISNGPGDPTNVAVTVERLRKVMAAERVPVFGICLGHQLLALAAGARTIKMKYGNRGQNIPCTDLRTGRCHITSQNHGYAVDADSLPDTYFERFVNANDGSNEGIQHRHFPYFSVQFHPESAPGPRDTEYLFDVFIDACMRSAKEGQLASLRFPGETDRSDAPRRRLGAKDLRGGSLRKVLILGSGGLSIGQAGEFDYSGSQAIKALKEENIYTILINPNIATIQTSKGLADKCYFLPITADSVRKVIQHERPDGIYVTFGGQTALNVGIEMKDEFETLNVTVLGTPISTIITTEDRELFSQSMTQINERCAQSSSAVNVAEAVAAARTIGYPLIVRAAFALGGLGSGFAETESELVELCTKAFASSPQVLIERSMKGWKEIEYEVVRDAYDNCITVCNMENFDPLGIHTGDSIVVAPSQTLSDEDYNMLRTTAINVIRHLGVVGECNIQYALNPDSKEYCIIEVNARLSRSSALASKATGYPLAFVASKLGLGIPLNEIRNSVTKKTSACFEPSLDYVVVKIPRWDLKKFTRVSTSLSSSMKSVGEVMAIGRTFEETIQKAIQAVEYSFLGFTENDYVTDLDHELVNPSDQRLFAIANALHRGYTVDRIWELTKIDRWFLTRLRRIVTLEQRLNGLTPATLTPGLLRAAKQLGFSDRAVARSLGSNEVAVRKLRSEFGVTPWVKQIDTVAAEFPAVTNYLYVTYNASEHDIKFEDQGIMVLGSGVYRIGSSVEFDWCAVRAIRTLRDNNFKTVMINYNPETVSTDYDEADRLYFENITLERILDIYEMEQSSGVMISMGGQTPNNIALPLHRQNVKILGTSPEMIDTAENRYKFSRMLDKIGVDQPRWKELTSFEEAQRFCDSVGYPVLVRPSYVLSGAAMNVVSSPDDLASYLNEATAVSREYPVVITKYIEEAKEIEMDAVALDGELIMHVVSEHVENAGVHSGDATLILPPQDLDPATVRKVETATRQIASALNVTGPFNIQFIAKDNDIKVIECNVRAARSFPFVSKVKGVDLIEMATRAMLGLPVEPYPPSTLSPVVLVPGAPPTPVVAVKVPQFSFSRLLGADPILGVEMASTGEVACFGRDKYEAYIKALLSTGFQLPKKNILFSIGSYKEKYELLPSVQRLQALGYTIFATSGTADFMQEHGVPVKYLVAADDSSSSAAAAKSGSSTPLPPGQSAANGGFVKDEFNLDQHMANNLIDLYINLPSKNRFRRPSSYVSKGYRTRRMAVDYSIPLITNVKCAKLFIEALTRWRGLDVSSVDYISSYRSIILPGLINVNNCLPSFNDQNRNQFLNLSFAAVASGITTVCVNPVAAHGALTDPTDLAKVQDQVRSRTLCDMVFQTAATDTNYTALAAAPGGGGTPLLFLSFRQNREMLNKSHIPTVVSRFFKGWNPVGLIVTDAEGADLASVLLLASLYRRTIHVTNVTTRQDIELIAMSKDRGLRVTCDVPHTALFVRELLEVRHRQTASPSTTKPITIAAATDAATAAANSATTACGPTSDHHPIPADATYGGISQADSDAMWEHMETIDCISTGQSILQVCAEAGRDCIPGFGLEGLIASLLTAVANQRMSVDDLRRRLHDNPRRIFGIPEQPDTYMEVELDRAYVVPATGFRHSPAAWSPFNGMTMKGVITRVMLRGRLVYLDGTLFMSHLNGLDVTHRLRPDTAVTPAAAAAPILGVNTPVAAAGANAAGGETSGPSAGMGSTGAALKSPTVASSSSSTVFNPSAAAIGALSAYERASNLAAGATSSVVAGNTDGHHQFLHRHQGEVRDHLAPGTLVTASASQATATHGGTANTQLIEGLPSSLSRIGIHSPFYQKHILSVRQFTREELHVLFGVAQEMRVQVERHGKANLLPGRVLCTVFFEPSSRTQCSFAAAMQRLGGTVVSADAANSSVAKGESLPDTVRTLGAYGDIVVVRHPQPGSAELASKYCPVPVINAGDGTGEHPSQAMLDVYTIREELGTVNGLTITLVGDLKNGRTVHSLVRLLALYDVTLNYVSPSSLSMPEDIQRTIGKLGIKQTQHTELSPEVVAESDVIYVTRVQKERFTDQEEYERLKHAYVIDSATLAHAKDHMALMHPLPRVGEIDPEVDFDPRAAYFRQMKYGMYVRMALLALVLGKSS
ncbi:Carbamoyl-phosphate synthase [Tieghemiomyces parasiticus]|uniref:Carbamoyl-phosphate synthase n=1 Tax=Tieghemiomyces parasiticus TaxID=78921 RepID=A0A9W7ZTD5_9FUNG|nr:Carbamoyl-phosphate synthase [Tieghemiomyces parasiticus]